MRNPEAVAWVVASEGSISIGKAHTSIVPRVNVYNTKEEFLVRFHGLVDGVGQIYSRGRRKEGQSPSLEWNLSTYKTVRDFLLEIYEYLPIKREQAEIVINFCIRAIEQGRDKSSGKNRPKYTQEDIDAYEMVKILNKKGGD